MVIRLHFFFQLPQRRSAVHLNQKQRHKKEEIRTHLPQGRISSDFLHLVRPTRFAPPGHKLRTVSGNKNTHPGGVDIFMVRPTRFERATYRVGVFRRILIKCCVFKGCAVFTDNTRFLWISRKPLKTLGKLAFSISSAIVVKQ